MDSKLDRETHQLNQSCKDTKFYRMARGKIGIKINNNFCDHCEGMRNKEVSEDVFCRIRWPSLSDKKDLIGQIDDEVIMESLPISDLW